MPVLERITTFESVSQVIAHLEVRASDSEKLLKASGFSRCDFARICCGDADWEPTIVLCAQDLSRSEADELVEVVGDGSLGLAVVMATEESSARWTAEIIRGKLRIEPLGVTVHPQPLGEHDLGSICRLLDLAANVSDSGVPEPVEAYGSPSGPQGAAHHSSVGAPGSVGSGELNRATGSVRSDAESTYPTARLVRAVSGVFPQARRRAEVSAAPDPGTDCELEGISKATHMLAIIDDPGSLATRTPAQAQVQDQPTPDKPLQGEPAGGDQRDLGTPASCAPVSVCLATARARLPAGDLAGSLEDGGFGHERQTERTPEQSAPLPRGDGGGPLRASGRREAPARTDVEVEVAVLGPVEIRGAERPTRRAGATELVVYLAMHRSGVASDAWAAAIWPDRVMAPSSLHSTASEARRALGRSKSGQDHLPRQHGRLQLASTVGSDWQRFLDLAGQGSPICLEQAMSLVRGEAFQGLRAIDWIVLEGFVANIEAQVVDVATGLAEHFLGVGDASGAEWAARQGLRISHYDERLYRVLMRAADAAGNPAGVERVMDELTSLVAEEVEPYDMVHPETAALYARLARGRRAPAFQQRAAQRA